jgi:MFS family permease
MDKKQLATLFICNLVPWIIGNGLVPLLPVYATQLGADSAVAGYYLAFSYLALACGALSAGWVSDHTNRRKLPLIAAGLVSIPMAWLMGQTNSIWSLTVFTALLWYAGGMGLALCSILAGMYADPGERGKVFGILTLTVGLGALVGGLGIGWLVELRGYTVMFNCLAAFLTLWPVSALFLKEKDTPKLWKQTSPAPKKKSLGRNFTLLFLSACLASITTFFIVLMRSIVMRDLDFSPLEISSTGAIGGVIAMPLPVLMGWLSDRKGRKPFLYAGILAAMVSLILLAFTKALWGFWIVFIFQGTASQGIGTIANALAADLVPRESLGKALSLIGSTGWIGGVVGFGLTGYAMQNLGVAASIIIGSLLAVSAIGLLIPIQTRFQ